MKHFASTFLLGVFITVGSLASAHEPPPQACQNIKQACEAQFQGPSVFKQCMMPIMHGQTVSGVSPNPADVAACKAWHKAHPHKQHHQNDEPAPSPAS